VAPPGGNRGFGSSALTASGKIFAMLSSGRLVVKLPRDRVAELIRTGSGEGYHAGKGRPMKEWLAVLDEESWGSLAREAYEFVSARRH
jgi:TfoX/Sxy family transcriptional regulator of competence genes